MVSSVFLSCSITEQSRSGLPRCLAFIKAKASGRSDVHTQASRGATAESTPESQSGFSVPVWSKTSAAVLLFVPRNVIAIREDLTLELYHRDATDGAVWRATSSRRMRIPKTSQARSVKLRDSRP